MLIKYVNERFGGDAPKVYAAAKISRKTYSAIVGNELRPVSKQTAIQLALALKLTRAEADSLLKAAGFAFSATAGFALSAASDCFSFATRQVPASATSPAASPNVSILRFDIICFLSFSGCCRCQLVYQLGIAATLP